MKRKNTTQISFCQYIKIMNKEMFEEIKKSFEPKRMTKSEWEIFIKECKEKLKKTQCFICDNNFEN